MSMYSLETIAQPFYVQFVERVAQGAGGGALSMEGAKCGGGGRVP